MPVSASILHPCSLGSQGQGLLSPQTVLGDGQYNTAAHRVFHGHLGRDTLAAPTLQTGTWALRALGSCPSSCGLWHRVRGEVSTAHSAPWARPWSSGPAALEERGHIYPFHLRPLWFISALQVPPHLSSSWSSPWACSHYSFHAPQWTECTLLSSGPCCSWLSQAVC